jgi:DNA-binding beta-propeller fold protein YncE/Flp pilus assembly protein TadD
MIRASGRSAACVLCNFVVFTLLLTGSPLASVETRAYRPAFTFGQEGQDVGQFRHPGGVVADAAGRLYTTDTYNHRVQVFQPDGYFIRTFGSEGAEYGALLRPKGLAWGANQLLYVVDTGNHRIQAFDQQGHVVSVLGAFGHSSGQLNAPEAMAVDAEQMLYVADTQNHRVQKFAPDGRPLATWGKSGSGRGEFLGPSDIAIDREGRVLVADTQNHRVQVFTADGQYLWEIGHAGRGAAEFDSPRGIATDDEGSIYVADTGNGRVQIFDRSGRYLAHVGHLGKGPGEFYSPAALWVDAHRALYVADTINHRIQVLTYSPALARVERGWHAFNTARPDIALDEWREALALDSSMAEALYGSGLAYARLGQPDLAIRQLDAALSLQPQYTEARWALYRVYMGKLALPLGVAGVIAVGVVGTLLIRRLRRRMLRERAQRFMMEGRVRDTIATYERLLQFDRQDLEICKVLENLYEQEGLESKRQQVNEVIARLEPDNIQALSYLGKQQFTERRFAEAQETWGRIIAQDASWAEAHFYLGAVQAERGQREAAMSAYDRAIALAIAGDESIAAGQATEAGRTAESQLTVMITAWERVLTRSTGYESALATFQQARRVLAQRYVTQGQKDLQNGQVQEAISHLQWAIGLAPGDDTARTILQQAQTDLRFDQGMRYYQAQDYVQALRCFRETLVLDPEHEKAKRYLRYTQQSLEGGVSERFRHLDLGDREKT